MRSEKIKKKVSETSCASSIKKRSPAAASASTGVLLRRHVQANLEHLFTSSRKNCRCLGGCRNLNTGHAYKIFRASSRLKRTGTTWQSRDATQAQHRCSTHALHRSSCAFTRPWYAEETRSGVCCTQSVYLKEEIAYAVARRSALHTVPLAFLAQQNHNTSQEFERVKSAVKGCSDCFPGPRRGRRQCNSSPVYTHRTKSRAEKRNE